MNMSRISTFVAVVALTVPVLGRTARAETEIVASQALTIQPVGPRQGEAGKDYFNVEGKDNEKFASFGVLVFELPKDIQSKELKGLALKLVQTAPRFAKDGAIKLFLAPDLDPKADLKFEADAPDGVGKQITPLHLLGSADFKDPEKGKTQTFKLDVNESVRGRIAKGGKLCLVIVPADAKVAATYFGANEDARENSPRLSLDVP
jgi:hypothetical protein